MKIEKKMAYLRYSYSQAAQVTAEHPGWPLLLHRNLSFEPCIRSCSSWILGIVGRNNIYVHV